MLPDNPFLQLVLPRATSILDRIQSSIWTKITDLSCEFGGAFPKPVSIDSARRLRFETVTLPFCWGQLFDQGWFRVRLPTIEPMGGLYLNWNDQGEGTLYLNGVPYYGFDVAHRYCRLPEGTTELFIEGLCLQSAIWHPAATGVSPEGSRLSVAALCTRDDLAWQVYHDLRVLFELTLEEAKSANPPHLPKTNGTGYQSPVHVVPVLYRRLLRALDDTFNAYDKGGLSAAANVLKEIYQRLAGQHEQIRAVLTGHAHIDLVWLWPEKTGEYKAVHTFSTMNRLMEVYPEFVFGYSQPASYDAVGKYSPALLEEVKARVRGGRWEPIGATEVESDTQLACGEALARSFLLGQKGFRRLQGKPSPVLWIPDVFGYSCCLPQIMAQTGVKYFFTTKLTWSNITLFPHSSFVWRGNDGSEVLAHVTQENGYNQIASPEELRRGARAYRQSDLHDEFLAPTGYGDGGGGVTEEMCERARRYQSLAGMPEARWGKIEDFFDKLSEVRPRLPVCQGELYLEYHRGVFTTHGALKAAFRGCERALQAWEAVRCATYGGELDDQPWRRMVFAQFHDYIPGSSIWEVYEEGLPELAAITAHALSSSSEELGDSGEEALFNPLPLAQTVLVRDGSKAVQLPPLGGASIASLPALSPKRLVQASPTKLQSESVSALFDSQGRVAELSFHGHSIAIRSPLAALAMYPDCPAEFEAWEIDRQNLSLGSEVGSETITSVPIPGGLEGCVEFQFRLSARSSGAVRYRLDAFQPVLHIEYDIDWQDERRLLRVLFPTEYSGRLARFGAPFGSVLRGQQPGGLQDEAMFECPGSRWAIVSDDGDTEGLGVVTEAKYGFSCRDGVLGLSLLRSPRVTGEERTNNKLFPPSLRRGAPRAEFADLGRHVIRLALCFHSPGQAREILAPSLAETLFTGPIFYRGSEISAGFHGLEEGSSLVPCWAKPASDGNGWILRLHETMGRRGVTKLKLSKNWQASITDLTEVNVIEGSVEEIRFTPYAIVSVRIARTATGK